MRANAAIAQEWQHLNILNMTCCPNDASHYFHCLYRSFLTTFAQHACRPHLRCASRAAHGDPEPIVGLAAALVATQRLCPGRLRAGVRAKAGAQGRAAARAAWGAGLGRVEGRRPGLGGVEWLYGGVVQVVAADLSDLDRCMKLVVPIFKVPVGRDTCEADAGQHRGA